MQLDRLIQAATGLPAGESKRRQHQAMADMLVSDGAKITAKGVEKWLLRGSIPGAWLMRIAHVAGIAGRTLNLQDYA